MALQPISGGQSLEQSGSSFEQQGSVDWVQLSSTTFSATLAVFARLSRGNVEAITVGVCQTIASKFKLSLEGTRKMSRALKELKGVQGMGGLLWMGFGIKHIVHELAATQQGLTSLALLGVISEVYRPEAAADILFALSEEFGAPEALQPSPQQWLALMKVCSGTLSTTNFGAFSGTFMRFGSQNGLDETGDPKAIAAALHAISQLSKGEIRAITLMGGEPCGWLAAVGSWLFGLSVRLHAPDGIVVLEQGISGSEQAHITVYYKDSRTSNTYSASSGELVSIEGTTFIINGIAPVASKFRATIDGRVEWRNCIALLLDNAAGLEGMEQQLRCSLGRALGYAARIYKALALCEDTILEDDEPETWPGLFEAQHGEGLVNAFLKWFPELEALESSMKDALTSTYPDALKNYVLEVEKLDTFNKSGLQWDSLETLIHTVVFITWNLAAIRLDAPLSPKRKGIKQVHENIYGYLLQDFEFDLALGSYRENFPNPLAKLLTLIVKSGAYTARHFAVYETAVYIFAGSSSWDRKTLFYDHTYDLSMQHPAICENGVCFYLDIIREATELSEKIDRPENAALLHVVPGVLVLRNGRHYQSLRDDNKYFDPHYNPSIATQSPIKITASEIEKAHSKGRDFYAELQATEDSSGASLMIVLKERISPKETVVHAQLGPLLLTTTILTNTSNVNCAAHCGFTRDRHGRSSARLSPGLALPETFVDREGNVQPILSLTMDSCGPIRPDLSKLDFSKGERAIILCPLQGNPIARCAAILPWHGCSSANVMRLKCNGRDESLFVSYILRREDHCINCCIKAAEQILRSRNHRVVFIVT